MSTTKLGLLALPTGQLVQEAGGQSHALVGDINGVGSLTGTLDVDAPSGEFHALVGSIDGAGTLFARGRQLQVAHSLFIIAPGCVGQGSLTGALFNDALFVDRSVAAVYEGTGFWIAEADANGNILMSTAQRLNPGPTTVRYPDRFIAELRHSKDGTTVPKGLIKDGRLRSWIWKRYKSTVPKYDTLYNRLLNYQYKLRQKASPAKSPYVYIRDTESGNLTIRFWTGNHWIEIEPWVKVRVVQVNRVPAAGGQTVFDETEFSFVIDDNNWNNY